MPSLPRDTSLQAVVTVRIVLAGFACLVIGWTLFSVPVFWHQSPVERLAKRIVAEETFSSEALKYTVCNEGDGEEVLRCVHPSILSSVAIINLRLLERATARSEQQSVDTLMRKLKESIYRSLSNSPSDPFLLTVLFWLENARVGFQPGHLEYLRFSYAVGPNEGWVAVKRNRFALAVFPALPPDIADDSVREFSRLVGSNYIYIAASILEGPGWPIRVRLMESLKNVNRLSRVYFANTTYRLGYDVAVPGIETPEWRPWR